MLSSQFGPENIVQNNFSIKSNGSHKFDLKNLTTVTERTEQIGQIMTLYVKVSWLTTISMLYKTNQLNADSIYTKRKLLFNEMEGNTAIRYRMPNYLPYLMNISRKDLLKQY